MTDRGTPSTPEDRAARLAALRERRQAAASTPAPAGQPAPSTTRSKPSRRRHAATGGRVLAAGLSVSASLGLMNAMAAAQPASTAATPPPAAAQAAPTVVVVHRAASTTAATSSAPVPAPRVNPTPVTATRGS